MSMLQNSIVGCIALGILLLPLVFWRYLFVSFFEYKLSRLQFFLGIGIGGLLTTMMLFHHTFSFFFPFWDIFFYLSLTQDTFFSWKLFFLLLQLFSFLFFIIFGISWYFQKYKQEAALRYLSSWISFASFLFVWLLLIRGLFWVFPHIMESFQISFWDIVFSSFGSILSYYIIISFLEEGGKYIAQLWFAGKKEAQLFTWYILVAASIALGFAFFENIFYASQEFLRTWFSQELLSLLFFRGLFSLTVHVLSSLLIALCFWWIFRSIRKASREYLWKGSLFFLWGIGVHTLFNLSLTFWYSAVLLFIFFGTYILLSYIIQKEHSFE